MSNYFRFRIIGKQNGRFKDLFEKRIRNDNYNRELIRYLAPLFKCNELYNSVHRFRCKLRTNNEVVIGMDVQVNEDFDFSLYKRTLDDTSNNTELFRLPLKRLKDKLYGPEIIVDAICYHLNCGINLLTSRLGDGSYQRNQAVRDYFFKLQLKRGTQNGKY